VEKVLIVTMTRIERERSDLAPDARRYLPTVGCTAESSRRWAKERRDKVDTSTVFKTRMLAVRFIGRQP
jgi:hypothetical protein